MVGSALSSAGARVVTLPLSAVFGLLTSKLVLDKYGIETFAYFGLLVSIIGLMSFTDFGVGAALNNTVAAKVERDTTVDLARVLLTVIRTLCISSLLVLLLGALATVFDLWSALLGASGESQALQWATGLCWAIFALAIPLGVGQRLLVAGGRAYQQVLLQGLQPILTFGFLVLIARIDAPNWWVPVMAFASYWLTNFAMTCLAVRTFPRSTKWAIQNVYKFRRVSGAVISPVARPMFVIVVALTLSLQSDRLVVSHFAGVVALSVFNISAQLFGPIGSLISVTSGTLWPYFARNRAAPEGELVRTVLAVVAGTAALCVVVTALAGPISLWLSQGRLEVHLELCLAYTVLLLCQSAQAPLGNIATDQRALQFQSRCTLIALPVNVVVSILLTIAYGNIGPLWGSAIATLFVQFIPLLIYVRRRLALIKLDANIMSVSPSGQTVTSPNQVSKARVQPAKVTAQAHPVHADLVEGQRDSVRVFDASTAPFIEDERFGQFRRWRHHPRAQDEVEVSE
jgi:O-antigen/teichoic acid export membrane protein